MQDALSEHVNMRACWESASVMDININIMRKAEGEMVDIRDGALGGLGNNIQSAGCRALLRD